MPKASLLSIGSAVQAPRRAAGLGNLGLLVQLRWLAVAGQVATIAVASLGLHIVLPLHALGGIVALLVAFNLLSHVRLRSGLEVGNTELLLALLIDVGALTAELYLCGGATNPFASLFLLQVILAAVLLERWASWLIGLITTLCFACLTLMADPLAWPTGGPPGLTNPYALGLLVCFVLNASLLIVFVKRIMGNLHKRDQRVAELRQRAAEEEHIVRMGLLASGAAHELGTPLSTLAVILGDWLHLPHFTSDAELLEELVEMEAQVRRCKAIVSGILLSAGGARGESSRATTVCDFLDGVVAHWRNTRPGGVLEYDNRFGADLLMVSDSTLQQMIDNVLDNALEASPQGVRLEVGRERDLLVLRIIDQGAGFPAHILEQLGKPYQSTKGRPGAGLGLFLVVNVARTLGGTLSARNRARGAEVVISLPLAAITLPESP
ncbi:MAG: HAMP domain-containing histidine kinase [Burkholderiaceae bacterium]|nr:HAMP domain-containing histidine kinase [Burkholderiaceae bacterium]